MVNIKWFMYDKNRIEMKIVCWDMFFFICREKKSYVKCFIVSYIKSLFIIYDIYKWWNKRSIEVFILFISFGVLVRLIFFEIVFCNFVILFWYGVVFVVFVIIIFIIIINFIF